MAIIKGQLRPEGNNDFADVVHPETSADMVIEDDNKNFISKEQKDKLDGLENYIHPSNHSADMIVDSFDRKMMTAQEKVKLGSVQPGANNYIHPGSGSNPHETTKADVGLSEVDNTKQLPIIGGTLLGLVKAQNNANYTTGQIRNITLSTANPSGGANGDIWIKYR